MMDPQQEAQAQQQQQQQQQQQEHEDGGSDLPSETSPLTEKKEIGFFDGMGTAMKDVSTNFYRFFTTEGLRVWRRMPSVGLGTKESEGTVHTAWLHNISLAQRTEEGFIWDSKNTYYAMGYDVESPHKLFFLLASARRYNNGDGGSSYDHFALSDNPGLPLWRDTFDEAKSVECHIEFVERAVKATSAVRCPLPDSCNIFIVPDALFKKFSSRDIGRILSIGNNTMLFLISNVEEERLRAQMDVPESAQVFGSLKDALKCAGRKIEPHLFEVYVLASPELTQEAADSPFCKNIILASVDAKRASLPTICEPGDDDGEKEATAVPSFLKLQYGEEERYSLAGEHDIAIEKAVEQDQRFAYQFIVFDRITNRDVRENFHVPAGARSEKETFQKTEAELEALLLEAEAKLKAHRLKANK